MPGSRCKDSATLLSGILPMSSGATDSIARLELRLASKAVCSDWRYPVTTISCRSSDFADPEEVVTCAWSSAKAACPTSEASSDTAVINAKRAAWRARFSLRCDMVLGLPVLNSHWRGFDQCRRHAEACFCRR